MFKFPGLEGMGPILSLPVGDTLPAPALNPKTNTLPVWPPDRIGERMRVTFAEWLEVMEVSPATLKRDIPYLRDRLHAPLIWEREAGGDR